MKNNTSIVILSCLLILIFLFVSSCNCRRMNSDEFIQEYDSVDFSLLKGKYIFLRSGDILSNTAIYFLYENALDCGPYAITFDKTNQNILKIKNDMVLESCGKDYLDKSQIEKIVKRFVKYKLHSVMVDYNDNVYLEYVKDNSEIHFMRKSRDYIVLDTIRYKHYKGNWYMLK
jgi:hypothetical protein